MQNVIYCSYSVESMNYKSNMHYLTTQECIMLLISTNIMSKDASMIIHWDFHVQFCDRCLASSE